MLVILSASGIWALLTNRAVVDDLAFDLTKAPQSAEVVAAAAALIEPIDRWPTKSDADTRYMQTYVGTLLDQAQQKADEFRRRSDQLPPTPVWMAQRPVTNSLIQAYGESRKRLNSLNNLMEKNESASSDKTKNAQGSCHPHEVCVAGARSCRRY